MRKKKDRSQKEKRPNQLENDYSRVMHIEQARALYMAGPQLLPFFAWLQMKDIEIYEEVYRG